ncbi:MAG: ABC-type dipeptide/oligopeptide/nickel transport system, permease component [Acidimicrobiales bacterium]|nr:ABC-type dipeptide/oligopeptide/nickel transport system, permease component [Acidimicrobiales bacterium]
MPDRPIDQGRDGVVNGPDEPGLHATLGAAPDAVLRRAEATELGIDPAASALDASLADVLVTRSLASDAWRRFRRNRLAMTGLFIVIALLLLGLVGPFFVQNPTAQGVTSKEAPTNQHWFGTDNLGQDVFARVVYGIRLSLFIGFVATAVETTIGITVGALAGWFRGWLDTILMRFVDIVLGIPYFVLALAMIVAIGQGVTAVVVTLAATAWLQTARTVRAGFLQVRDLEYVDAARTTGVPTFRIIWRHVLPNVFQPVVVLAAIGIGSAILAEAALSYLGVGIIPPTPSLGNMISQSQSFFGDAPHLLIFPGLAIILLVLGFLLVGDGLRDALDVKDV